MGDHKSAEGCVKGESVSQLLSFDLTHDYNLHVKSLTAPECLM